MSTIRYLSALLLCAAAGAVQADPYCDRLGGAQAVNYAPNAPVPLRPIAPRVALVALYHPGLFDFFYTANQQACIEAVYQKGYSPSDLTGYVDRSAQPDSVPLYGFWKGPPQTDHFYSSHQADIDYVLANGWVPLPATQDIHLTSAQRRGSRLLYRVHYFDHASAEAAHFYTTSWAQVGVLQNNGWIYDVEAGYVHINGTPPPNYAANGTTVEMGRRCEYLPGAAVGNCFGGNPPSNYRDFQFNQLELVANGPRTTKKTVQKMSFSFTHSRYFQSSMHLAAALRANTVVNTTDIRQSTFHGLGLAIGNFDAARCGFNGPGIAIEAFWPGGNNIQPQGCTNTAAFVDGARYDVTVQVDNAAIVSYSLRNAAGQLLASRQVNAANWFVTPGYPFPVQQGGHMLIDAGSTVGGDYDVVIDNFRTWWD
jgi:hypothetical protein